MTAPAQLYALCAAAHGDFPPPRRAAETGRGLAGAMLLQGVLAGRLDLYEDRVRPTGRGRRGDPVLDAFLAHVERSPRDRAPTDWVEHLGRLFWILSAEPAASGAMGSPQARRAEGKHGKAEVRTVYWACSGAPTTRPGAVPGVAGRARSERDGPGPEALAAPRPGLLPGGAEPPGRRAGIRPCEALQRVRGAVAEPDCSALHAVAAGALLAASGLHDLCWPALSRDEASRRTLRAVAALGHAGLPVARAATAVSHSLSGSASTLAFPG
ncbi:GPP34 family phosphoprotein [Streptomyces sp. NPDC056544]|uniref:GPP34 family phosphoprotein n=1 Tax=unclassified Streptomyces TaxID=2593676 RepID=UPI0036774357